jgi:hypothetical protein
MGSSYSEEETFDLMKVALFFLKALEEARLG